MRTTTNVSLSALTVAAFALALTSVPPRAAGAQDTLPPAKTLIAKAAAATNASSVMAKHQSVRTKGRFEMPAQGVSGDLEISQARPNRTIMRINISGIGVIENGFDGTTAWQLNPMQGPRIMTGKELDAVREEASFGTSSRMGPNVASAETVERTQMNGEACYKVKVVWKSGRETMDCYSVASGLLIATVGKQESPMGTVEITNLVSDYKDFGGQKIATRLTQQAMGQEQVLVLTSVDYDAAPDSTFRMPAAIKALVEKKP